MLRALKKYSPFVRKSKYYTLKGARDDFRTKAESLSGSKSELERKVRQYQRSLLGKDRECEEMLLQKEKELHQKERELLQKHKTNEPKSVPRNLLGVGDGASKADIEHAYRQVALRFHPDKGKSDKISQNIFRAATLARDTLLSSQSGGSKKSPGHKKKSGAKTKKTKKHTKKSPCKSYSPLY